jgi:hypothetical protein
MSADAAQLQRRHKLTRIAGSARTTDEQPRCESDALNCVSKKDLSKNNGRTVLYYLHIRMPQKLVAARSSVMRTSNVRRIVCGSKSPCERTQTKERVEFAGVVQQHAADCVQTLNI